MTNEVITEYKLTQFTESSGCGCKIPPELLSTLLAGRIPIKKPDNLLVGAETKDDAAAYDMGNGQAMICTADFFTPIVDDAFNFGRIAAANAISDVYAMGGKPQTALALLGFPVNKMPIAIAGKIMEGAEIVCQKAGIVIAGGHSIGVNDVFFGLSVTGTCPISHLKRNSTAQPGDLLFITKPIGVGVMAAALKRGQLAEEDYPPFINQLTTLNQLGEILGTLPYITAMTDVTGFGLGGHTASMATASNCSCRLTLNHIPVMAGVEKYLAQNIMPDATYKNWNHLSKQIQIAPNVDMMRAFSLLCDPQTNGGLLIAVNPNYEAEFKQLLISHSLEKHTLPIGLMTEKKDSVLYYLNSTTHNHKSGLEGDNTHNSTQC